MRRRRRCEAFQRAAHIALAAALAVMATSRAGFTAPSPRSAADTASTRGAPRPTDAARREAADRFDLGLRLFEGGDNAAALAEFKRAHELVPNQIALYNIGLVYAAMIRPVEAVDALDQALADGGARLSPEQRRNARQVRDEQSARVARVMIVTDRPATVEIDGVEAGRTPLAQPLRVPSGSHTISVVATGYLPSRRQLMFAGQVTETLTLTLTPTENTAAHLTVSASVPGADVLINGKPAGSTPLPASVAVAPGRTEVQIRRSGYRTATRTINLDEGASGTIEVALEEEDPGGRASPSGRLRLTLGQPDAEVAIDGVVRSLAPDGALVVPAGPHQLRVRRAGFQPAERLVAVARDRETALVATLAPTLEAKARTDEDARTWRRAAAIVLGSGLLVASGAAVYLAATHGDLSTAEADLNAQLRRERDPVDDCYHGTDPPPKVAGKYEFIGCGEQKASLEDAADRAKLRRNLGYGAGALGLVVAGVGTYLLLRAPGETRGGPAVSQIALWSDGPRSGLLVGGSF